MELDDDLTEEDWLILDTAAQEQLNSSSNATIPIQPSENNEGTPQSVDDLTDFFEDDGEPELEDLECLKSKFRHPCFRAKQWDIIKSLREQRDVCAVMATGYGKSLVYQFCAVRTNKITLVICPLISLMQAQVMDLEKINVRACYVGSAQKDPKILDKIANGDYSVVYSSPEYIQSWKGSKLLSILKDKLVLVAIDEAHCVSQWGHEFRPDYRKLNIIRQRLPAIPIVAVTATATENVRYDIVTLLGLREPRVVMTSFDRTNLEFIVRRKTTVDRDLYPLIRDFGGSIIIYVLKRTDTEELAKKLNDNGMACEPYHAGLNKDKRAEVLKKFKDDELKLIVATIAFGMGIDKKDVRCVIHYGASKNLESYYQEVGRAGRDGKPSKVITFFSPDDFETHDWFLDNDTRKHRLSAVIKNYLRGLAAKMRDFLYSTQCRRKTILEYFGENTPLSPRPNCCDNCTIGLGSWRLTDLYHHIDDNGIYNFRAEAKILLEAIKCLKLNGISTEKSLIKKFLIGEYDQRLQQVRYNRCNGSGSNHSGQAQYWLALIEQLSHTEYIEMEPNGTMLTLTSKAHDWLEQAFDLRLKAIGQMFEYFDRKSATPLVVDVNRTNRYNVTRAVTDLLRKDYVLSNELLKQILNEVRDAIYSRPANVLDKNSIASMSDLEKMVKAKPKNLDEFRFALKGTFNEEKVSKFGPTFVNAVSRFTTAQLEMQNVLFNHPLPTINTSHVVSPQILSLLKERRTKEDILKVTHLTEQQLFDGIATLIQTGQPILQTDIAYMSHIDFKIFSRLIQNPRIDITTVEQVDDMTAKYFQTTSEHIDSSFIRLGLTYYAVRFHLNRLCVPYIDCEQNVLVNAEKLIAEERTVTLNTDYRTDRQYAPYRINRYHPQSFMDFFFVDYFSYDPYDDDEYGYDYDEYVHYGSDSNAGSDRDDDEASEEEDNEVIQATQAIQEEDSDESEEDDNEASQEQDNEASGEEDNEVIQATQATQEEDSDESEEDDDEASQDNESSDEEYNESSDDESELETDVESDTESVTEDEEESESDNEELPVDSSDSDDDSDGDDGSDSEVEYESQRHNYGRKRQRMNN